MLSFITWDANPTIISWPVTIRWYGLMFAIGFWIGFNIVARMFRHEGAPERWLGTLLLYVGVGTVVGARLGHVFFYAWDYYSQHPVEILYTWEGGLASHGGAIGVILAVILFSIFVSKRSPMWTFDRLVIAIALVGGLIRFGNLMNSEIYGHYTDMPWGFIFVRNGETLPAHPTQIYEALCYFALFGLLMWMYWRKNAQERPGLIFGTFLVGIFMPRFLIEYVKNVQEPWEADMVLNMGQLLSIPFVLLGIFLIVRAYMRPRLALTFPERYADEDENKSNKK
ncbi:MAG: prolipoprotein diacylglyceryl transferase [Muribaculaceae bacterium]|jgi:prolipoprotein diacylglyceryl transferase|nr:prolipoprotein diacylglyceryl transferase [Muribaculaceae bacterium]